MMLCSGLSSTLLLAATCSLITSGFIRAQVPPPVTPISTGRVVTSNGLSVHRLSCVGGMIIVRSAEYRCGGEVICSHGDAVNNVRNSCDGKTECDIKSNITYDPGVCKYLETTYDCFPRQSVTCQNFQSNLQCDEGQVIVVSWANYGRRDKTTCSHGRPVSQLQNVHCTWSGSMNYVTTRCNGTNSCTVDANISEDPCVNIYKYLEVFYTCQRFTRAQLSLPSNVMAISTGRVITFNVPSVLQLSCGSGVMIVQSVLYRCADKEICSRLHDLDFIKKSCDLKEVCEINTNMVCTCDPSVCTYLDITFTCVPAIHSVTCQESQANLQCGEGQVIVVSWVNYGRRDNTTCSHGRPVSQIQNVHCSSPSSAEYVTNRCNWQNNCTVGASNTVFGDPCGGTYKYLEVVYDCQAPSCPAGWTWFGGRCFILNSSLKTWTDAESSCQTLGGNLASFHSTAEYTFIRELTRTAAGSYTRAWVGGNDRETETVWKWSDGSQFDFTNWGNGEPDNYGEGEDCMEINREGDYVNDQRCNSQRGFVCVRGP
uniref:uncharacterized protein LOC101472202 n=1 Tax=Maylandia zebra TaxID=106582 RepID=UPI000D2FF33F|nr:uncharacterized protein LOC101472202 [Maylandia zebra]